MSRKIILDCDPGHDDAVAMLLAHANPNIELLAVTTVGGNQTLEKVTNNALSLATVYGMQDVPVAAGCTRPLLRPVETAPDCHGDSGLRGAAPRAEIPRVWPWARVGGSRPPVRAVPFSLTRRLA